VLYLSYDGMCDPLGGSQVLPYLFGLAQRGHEISLISFEKPGRTTDERAAVDRTCASAGIEWHPLSYHKQPPILSSMYDIAQMSRLSRRLHKRRKFDLVHCRSYLPSLVGLRMKRRRGVPFVFDMRGFWADERLEGGAWDPKNPLFRAVYNYFKRREGEFWREADEIVSLTRAGERVLRSTALSKQPRAPITVIPCCVDFDAFPAINQKARHQARELLGISSAEKVLGYIGSLGGNYLLNEMLDFFSTYQGRYDGRAKFLFVTHVSEGIIRNAAAARGVPNSAIIVRSASRAEVPQLMAAADAGIAFKQPTYSAKACSPTKLGEMLSLELPIVTNSGVGDVARVIEETDAGVVVHRFDDHAYRGALEQLERLRPDMSRWRTAARRWFDLAEGVERYDAIYRRVIGRADK
jgi:glycosyltransferase involved in cell wall biosynthesis